MGRRLKLFFLYGILILILANPVHSNEMQRLVFNAAGIIGMVTTVIELQGITPENSSALNGNINAAVIFLNQLIERYFDPPFKADSIRRIVRKLEKFTRATARMNNRARAAYMKDCYADLKEAMSIIYRSEEGLKYRDTCDTYIASLGYYCGRALVAVQLNDRFQRSMAISGINNALRSGRMVRQTLGCSFPVSERIRGLRVQEQRTPDAFSRLMRNLEQIVRTASLNKDPGYDSPATKRKVRRSRLEDPPPPVNRNDLSGKWANGRYVISKEGGQYVCRQYDDKVPAYYRGYRKGIVVLKFNAPRGSASRFQGSYLYWRYNKSPVWLNATVEHIIKSSSNREDLKISYKYDGKKRWIRFGRFRRR